MIGLASLGSGSRGNATLVCFDDVLLLVDCGFTAKQAESRLARLGVRAGDLAAILVTHEHSDHAAGVAQLAHKNAVKVFASHGTLANSQRNHSLVAQPFDGDVPFDFCGVNINPVRVPHDAREPTQFVMTYQGAKVGVLSDLGCVTPHVREQFSHCDLLMLEANHDVDMLEAGSYPPALKRRIRSNLGHLSNEQSAALLQDVGHGDLRVLIGHVSEENNHIDRLKACFDPLARQVASIAYANQSFGHDWLILRGTAEEVPVGQPGLGFDPQPAEANVGQLAPH